MSDTKKTVRHVYIAGPMTGIKDHNFPAFNAAAEWVRTYGNTVFNPANNFGGDTSRPVEDYMQVDLEQVLKCDEVYVLPGWKSSKGARLEVAVAAATGKLIRDSIGYFEPNVETFIAPVYGGGRPDISPPTDEESILQEAERIVSGVRGKNYGHPFDDFAKQARMWSVILNAPVLAEQVPLCMIAVKISRELNTHKRDNLVDIAGYAKTVEMVHEERLNRYGKGKDAL